ncbi:DNA (cytosine-5-)-methyltransferase [Desulfurobacterium sp.]|uniref:DNA cytosine methyltransferase n=1 Tax=Desulfurobacterium sp. TaxID=2004706 RepID=UPI002603CE44|nr:DNA (cytosine-5-)-methyltransferase [Desulfurobacterium sp.]
MGKIRFFDLFAGMGGFRVGLEAEGYRCIGFCEIDPKVRSFYKAVYGTEGEFEWDDVRTIPIEEMPDFEVLTAGIPCQPFSTAGKRRGLKDERAYPLWNSMFRIIERKRPTVCIFENVKGLFSADRGWAFAYLLYKMAELGYDGEWTVFNSKAFGVPQNRERVYLVFYIRGKSRGKVFPFSEEDKVYYIPPAKKSKGTGESPIVYDPFNQNFKKEQIVNTLRTNFTNGNSWIVKPKKVGNIYPSNGQAGDIYDGTGISPCLVGGCGTDGHWGGNVPKVVANTVPSGHRAGNVYSIYGIAPTVMENHGKIISVALVNGSRSQGYRVFSPEGIGITLVASSSGEKAGLYAFGNKDNIKIRKLTPLECFRLQGFPDWVYYKGKEAGFSNSLMYKMAGNAVTVQIPQSIARKLKNLIRW